MPPPPAPPVPDPVPGPRPEPTPAPEPVPAPEPAPAPEPTPAPEPVPAPEPAPTAGFAPAEPSFPTSPSAAPPAAAPQAPPVAQAAPVAAPAPPAPSPAPSVPVASPAPFGVSPSDVSELLPTIADQMPGNAVKAALGQARVLQASDGTLLLGLPEGKGSSARLLNREDARAAIAAALHEVLGVRFEVRAEERDGLTAPEEPLLPEAEVIRRVVQEFEAQEVSADAAADSSTTTPNPGDA